MNAIKLDLNKISELPTMNDLLDKEHGKLGTTEREVFNTKARAWYLAELLKERRKDKKITQAQLAERIGKKREYIALLERGETDMQLSTFLSISEALGMHWELSPR